MRNAQYFIEAGGRATWKMIRFKHNEHQIEQAKQLSQTLGFVDFIVVESPRTNGPVFNNNFELEYVLGTTTEINARQCLHTVTYDDVVAVFQRNI